MSRVTDRLSEDDLRELARYLREIHAATAQREEEERQQQPSPEPEQERQQ